MQCMNVIDHGQDQWILLRDGNDYFMEVITGISYQPISMVVKLEADQVVQVKAGGHEACQALAGEMADNWMEYADLDGTYEEVVYEAIGKWRRRAEKA